MQKRSNRRVVRLALLLAIAMLLQNAGQAKAEWMALANENAGEQSISVSTGNLMIETDAGDSADEEAEDSENRWGLDLEIGADGLIKTTPEMEEWEAADSGASRMRVWARAVVCPTEEEVYQVIIALQAEYPEGMTWTNFEPYGSRGELGPYYRWQGGSVGGAECGVGCAAFVFISSDRAFGSLPSRTINGGQFKFEDVKVGDILRVNGSHFVIVLQRGANGVVVAEGNYNKSVHWGRALSRTEVEMANFLVTRYPEGYMPSDDPSFNEEIASGTEGNLQWSLTRGGELTISGTGAMSDYDLSIRPSWEAYSDAIHSIVIREGITRIGDYAFYQSQALDVLIPRSVQTIGNAAFRNSKLIGVTIPGTTKSIGTDAFRGCANLTSASIEDGVEIIGDNAFRGCTELKYADFPGSIIRLGAGAFMDCTNMTSVRFKPGEKVAEIGDNLFTGCWHLTIVVLPKNANRISSGMFQSCPSLMYLYVPASVKQIGAEPGTIGASSPFTQSGLMNGLIQFGGSEAEWNAMVTSPEIKVVLQNTQVQFNEPYVDYFGVEDGDPGDLIPDESKPDPEQPGKHEHQWKTEWSFDAEHHWHECAQEGCDATENALKDGYAGHEFGDWVVEREATVKEDGSKYQECRDCQYRKIEVIPATGGETEPSETDPENPDPSKPDPENPKPSEPDSGNVKPSEPDPGNVDSSKPDPENPGTKPGDSGSEKPGYGNSGSGNSGGMVSPEKPVESGNAGNVTNDVQGKDRLENNGVAGAARVNGNIGIADAGANSGARVGAVESVWAGEAGKDAAEVAPRSSLQKETANTGKDSDQKSGDVTEDGVTEETDETETEVEKIETESVETVDVAETEAGFDGAEIVLIEDEDDWASVSLVVVLGGFAALSGAIYAAYFYLKKKSS